MILFFFHPCFFSYNQINWYQFIILIDIKYNLEIVDTCNAGACGWEASRSSSDTCRVFRRLNDSFRDGLGKVEASPLVWRDAWQCLLMVCRWQTLLSSFLLFSLIPSKSTLVIQNFRVVLSFIDISTLVFFFLGPLVEFQFAFNLIIWSIIVICCFFKILIFLFYFDLFSNPYVNLNFLFSFFINSKFQVVLLFIFISNLILILSIVISFWILSYN
jgi:hypothetical protein